MFKFIRRFLTQLRGRSNKEITLLIIGPPSCGKTALIYFLYRFASNHLTGRSPNKRNKAAASRKASADKDIKEIELPVFVNQMNRELEVTKDFIGTEPGSIDFINYDTGLLNLKIFNISGEIFSQTDRNSVVLKKLAEHLDLADINHVYCLLADEVKVGVPINYNVDMFAVNAFFTAQGLLKASQIFHNINSGINTLRVVTKFDRKYMPKKPDPQIKKNNQKEFDIYNKGLDMLNHSVFYNDHEISYPTPGPIIFSGSNKELYKTFVCTGLYDKSDYTKDLYETGADKKTYLKEQYWRRNGLNRLEMYGIVAIFYYILKNYGVKRKVKIITPPVIGRKTRYQISLADYKQILNA